MRLVGAIELVSPRNKDRPEARQAFVAKCAAYLQEQVGLLIVEVVTVRKQNLHRELLQLLGASTKGQSFPRLYAAAYHNRREEGKMVRTIGGAQGEGEFTPIKEVNDAMRSLTVGQVIGPIEYAPDKSRPGVRRARARAALNRCASPSRVSRRASTVSLSIQNSSSANAMPWGPPYRSVSRS